MKAEELWKLDIVVREEGLIRAWLWGAARLLELKSPYRDVRLITDEKDCRESVGQSLSVL